MVFARFGRNLTNAFNHDLCFPLSLCRHGENQHLFVAAAITRRAARLQIIRDGMPRTQQSRIIALFLIECLYA